MHIKSSRQITPGVIRKRGVKVVITEEKGVSHEVTCHKAQLRLSHAASYTSKKVHLPQIFFSEAVVVLATYHGKSIIRRKAPRKNNDIIT